VWRERSQGAPAEERGARVHQCSSEDGDEGRVKAADCSVQEAEGEVGPQSQLQLWLSKTSFCLDLLSYILLFYYP
jgi:hypothetical protein